MFEKIKTHLALISALLYSSFQVISNILSVKIVLLPLVNLAMDGGTVIYPLTFTLRDLVHKTWGKKSARVVVIFSALLSLLSSLLFWLVGKIPPEPAWTLQQSYNAILLPVFRITAASIIAQMISELIDTEIFSIFYKKMNDVAGSFFSNSISLVADSLIFCSIAFWGTLPFRVLMGIFFSNIIVKLIFSTVSVPLIKLTPRTVDFDQI